jgi:hypothetical protein
MVTAELLRAIHRVEDLPRLAVALGYEARWRELPSGSLTGNAGPVLIGQLGDFCWYGIPAPAGGAAKAARALSARGLPAVVVGFHPETRSIAVACGVARSLAIQLDAPDPLALARLSRASAIPGEHALASVQRIGDALNGLGVDQRFFAGFRRVLEAVIAALPSGIPRLDRHGIGLLLLTRILFLYFVEAKGWLAGRPRFLREEVDRCLAARRSLHRDLLQPLFFGTLNRPADQRSALARRYGAVPFLNGGLFEPHPLERRWRVTVPTPVVRDAFDTLFERFHFTLSAAPNDAIAPDMLGRVFEGVMAPDERHASGTYYTPDALVRAVLHDGLATWLAGRLGIGWSEAAARLDSPDPLTRRALHGVRLLDPAVGSGAFLLGALRLLAGPGGARRGSRASALRRVLAGGLFGVDRNPAAVRLAELRLWLEVVEADPGERPEQVAPLPNLDALVRQGDSLRDPADGAVPFRLTRRRALELAGLRRAVLCGVGPSKAGALRALRRSELMLAREAAGAAVQRLDARITELLDLARSPTLFGGPRGLSREEGHALRSLRVARRRERERRRLLDRSGEVPWFSYATQFADVLARGGFDLVVGNPPWVRAESLAPETRRQLAERFRWMKGARAGGSGYAHQPDLAVAFLARALELTAPQGVVAYLVPAKLATTGYAAAARAGLARHTTISLAASLAGDPRAGFDATVYPMALVTANAPPPEDHLVRLTLDSPELANGIPQRLLSQGPWLLGPGSAGELIQRIGRRWPPLGERFTCHLGVKTGLNRVFLDPGGEVEPELVRWAVRGRDIRPFRTHPVRRILWPCDDSGRPLPRLPPGAARHFSSHQGALRRRADHAGGPPWEIFRTGPALSPYRVVWSDVARRLEAAPLNGRTASTPIALNSCYLIPLDRAEVALRLTAWLNSSWSRGLARAGAEPASGGFARFNARVVSMLPLPEAVLHSTDLFELARRGMAGTLDQTDLDDCCADMLGLASGERRLLAELAGPGTVTGR